MRLRAFIALPVLLAVLTFASPAGAMGSPNVAALQVTLWNRGLYHATIDGVKGPLTTAAVRRLQRRRGLVPDGIVGPKTRRALGRYARYRLGDRVLFDGTWGWDVAALQFRLAWHGFLYGPFDGRFGTRTGAALFRYQRWRRIGADGVAGQATIRTLSEPVPRSRLRFSWPIRASVGDPFGPRGNRFHPGIDFPAAWNTRVGAARQGRVVFAGWSPGGRGRLVIVSHGYGMRSFYAHLNRVTVRAGQHVARGMRVGLVGSSGFSTGPHLHFELRRRGAAVDPLPALR
jgi:peptidoglycan hydrolase-like protein with peptidoglycan-binding domain